MIVTNFISLGFTAVFMIVIGGIVLSLLVRVVRDLKEDKYNSTFTTILVHFGLLMAVGVLSTFLWILIQELTNTNPYVAAQRPNAETEVYNGG